MASTTCWSRSSAASVYRYSLKDAMDDGVLAELRLVNLIIDMSRAEVAEYQSLEVRLHKVRRELERRRPDLFEHEDWAPGRGSGGP